MKKKILFPFSVCLLTIALCTLGVAASSDKLAEDSVPTIDSFRDYEWGATLEEIENAEITSDMEETLDYQEENAEGLTGLIIKNGSVAGFDTEIAYIFDEDGLTAGAYDPDIDEDSFDEWVEKYVEKYGDPVLEVESIGWGKCTLWTDASKNFIFLSGITGISYVEADSPYLKLLNNGLDKFYGIDLEEELDKICNTDGI